jgi:hypothetical protein
MKTIRLLLLVVLVAFCPARAYALEGWWDWLDALSGPGPYVGVGAIGHSFCVPGMPRPANTNCFRENSDRDQRFRQVIDVRTGWMTDVGDQRFQDDPRDLGTANVWSLEGIYLFRLSGSFQIDVGPGVGLMRFSGKDRSGEGSFDAIYRFTIIPVSFSFAPLAPKDVDWLRLRLDSIYVPDGFSGNQFGNTETSFSSGGEFLTRLAVVYRF